MGLPRQRRGTTPQLHGRYPDYDVLEQASHWDEETRKVVLDRVTNAPEYRFFEQREVELLSLFCDLVLAQDREPRVPVLRYVDDKLWNGRLDGFRFADMPDDRETWRLLARRFDELGFGDAEFERQHELVEQLSKGELDGLPPRTWKVVTRAILSAFYAHPWAWNEIGFGGPAYPRGYMRLGIDQHEPWEETPAFDIDSARDVKERGLEQ